MADSVDNALMLEILKEIRREQRDHRTLLLQVAEQNRRLERRINDLKDDLELIIKAELMGRLGNFETRIESRLDRIGQHLGLTDGAQH